MLLLRRLVSFAVPSAVALGAFLHARALGSSIDDRAMAAASVAAFAEARAATSAPPCEGVRASVSAIDTEPSGSFAALDGRGRRLRRSGDALGMEVVYVGGDRVLLSKDGVLCQAPVLGGTAL